MEKLKIAGLLAVIVVVLITGCSKQSSTSPEAQIVLEYINVFQNGSDVEAKKKFVEEKIHNDVKSIFSVAVNSPSNPDTAFIDPQVVETIDYKKDGKTGVAVLVQGNKNDKRSEEIFLVIDGKIGWGFSDSDPMANRQLAFEQIRAQFKTAVPN